MLHCPYQQNRAAPFDEEGKPQKEDAKCMILTVACGFIVSIGETICAYCINGQTWNDADVPQLNPDAEARTPSESDVMKLVAASAFFASLYKQSLSARLIGGDCPRYQGPNPVNMSAAFTKYRTAKGDAETKDLLVEMFEKQSRIPESDGGDPPEVLAAKLAASAAENDMEDALLEAIERHELAAARLPAP